MSGSKKIVLSLSFLLGFNSLYANDLNKQEKNIETHKRHMLKNLDLRISEINNLKKCIQAATNKENIKACNSKHKEIMEKHKETKKNKQDNN